LGLFLSGMRLKAERLWWDTGASAGLQGGDGHWEDAMRWSFSAQGQSHGLRAPLAGDEVRFESGGGGRIQIVAGDVGGMVIGSRGYIFDVVNEGRLRIGRGGITTSEEVLFRGPITLEGDHVWMASGRSQLWVEGSLLWNNRLTTAGTGDFYFTGGRAASLSGTLLLHRGPGRCIIRGAHTKLRGLQVEGGVVELNANQWQDANVGGRIEIGPGGVVEAATQTFGFHSVPLVMMGGELVLTGEGLYVGRGHEAGGTVLTDAWVRDLGRGDIRLRGRIEMKREREPVRVTVKTIHFFQDSTLLVEGSGMGVDAQMTTTLLAKEPRSLVKAGKGTLGIDGEVRGPLRVRITEGMVVFHGAQKEEEAEWVIDRGAILAGNFTLSSLRVEPGGQLGKEGLSYVMTAGHVEMMPGSILHVGIHGTEPGELHDHIVVGSASIEGAELVVTSLASLSKGTRLPLMTGRVTGKFAGTGTLLVQGIDGQSLLRVEYEEHGVFLVQE